MSISVNRATLVGRVGADPEKKGRDGEFVTMSVATSRSWRDKQTGEKREKTDWHRVVIFNEQAAKFASQYVRKGDLVYVEGRIETRKWEKSPGEDVYITEVIVPPYEGVLQVMSKEPRASDEDRSRSRSPSEERTPAYSGSTGRDIDDEIPF